MNCGMDTIQTIELRRDYGTVNSGTCAAGLEEGSLYRGLAPWFKHQKACSFMASKRD